MQSLMAFVSKPNTPESDLQSHVLHTVEGTFDGHRYSTEINATDPMDAIDKARNGNFEWNRV